LHQAGELGRAKAIYRAILDREPNDAMALHYLGVIAHQTGRPAEALAWMKQSIAAAPQVADFHCNFGVLLRDCHRLDEAAAALCTAIQLRPKYPEALTNLGDVLRQQGRLAEAEAVLREAVALRPSAAALNNLGLVLMDRGRPRDAAMCLRDALKHSPREITVVKSLGTALRLAGWITEAVEVGRMAAELGPGDADAFFGLGNSLRAANELPEAADAYRRAAKLCPDNADLLVNLAGTLADLAEVDEAIAVGATAVALRPKSSEARYNLALALLLGGRFEQGWKMYEARWGCEGFMGTLLNRPEPIWDGGDLRGKTILLRAEQGCGDTMQFARYVPLLAARGAKVVLECQEELKRLLEPLAGVGRVVARGEEAGGVDCHLPLLSVAERLGTTLETIPGGVPYLKAPADLEVQWATRLGGYSGLKVGLVWAGNRNHRNDRNRSVKPAELGPLAGMAGVQFFSLQKGVTDRPEIGGMVDLSGELGDYAQTAGVLANLDLLVSVDTSVAHLAGAMGRAVWTLIPHGPDWRWMIGREDSPWYPTMRLIRQKNRGDWSGVISQVRDGIAKFAK
jgi:Flp pilus assembly protein TadD